MAAALIPAPGNRYGDNGLSPSRRPRTFGVLTDADTASSLEHSLCFGGSWLRQQGQEARGSNAGGWNIAYAPYDSLTALVARSARFFNVSSPRLDLTDTPTTLLRLPVRMSA